MRGCWDGSQRAFFREESWCWKAVEHRCPLCQVLGAGAPWGLSLPVSGSRWLGAGWGHLQGGGGPRAVGTTPGVMIWVCPASSTPAATCPKPRELKKTTKAFLLKYSVHTDKCVYHECSILSNFLKLKYLCITQSQNQNLLAPPEPLLFFLLVYTPDPRATPFAISGTISTFLPAFELLFKNFIYLFLAALGLRCCVRAFSSCGGERGLLCSRGAWISHRSGLFCRARALEHAGFRSCDSQAQLPCSMWDLPGPEFNLVPLALQGGFLTPEPAGKSLIFLFFFF